MIDDIARQKLHGKRYRSRADNDDDDCQNSRTSPTHVQLQLTKDSEVIEMVAAQGNDESCGNNDDANQMVRLASALAKQQQQPQQKRRKWKQSLLNNRGRCSSTISEIDVATNQPSGCCRQQTPSDPFGNDNNINDKDDDKTSEIRHHVNGGGGGGACSNSRAGSLTPAPSHQQASCSIEGCPTKNRQPSQTQLVVAKNQKRTVEARTQQHGNGLIPKARIKTVKMTFVIVIAFILCWSPFCIINLFQVFGLLGEDSHFTTALTTLSMSLVHLNSAVNPIIFWLFSSKRHNSSVNSANTASSDTARGSRARRWARGLDQVTSTKHWLYSFMTTPFHYCQKILCCRPLTNQDNNSSNLRKFSETTGTYSATGSRYLQSSLRESMRQPPQQSSPPPRATANHNF